LQKAPLAIQTVSLANPLTYAVDMLRAGLLQVYVPLPIEIAALVAESLIAFVAATTAFRRVKP
jgi:ABC-type polysaccharide/polyol phosphate export permease